MTMPSCLSKIVKLFANGESMEFSNVSVFPPSNVVILSLENSKGKPIFLQFIKFQNVCSLTIFEEDNPKSKDKTKASKIAYVKDCSYTIIHQVVCTTRSQKQLK
ncbi:hypothetical protein L7F22_010891 [Adiantum nelumboides]|nr:hypothetical protein [Adiantum nelumboides]